MGRFRLRCPQPGAFFLTPLACLPFSHPVFLHARPVNNWWSEDGNLPLDGAQNHPFVSMAYGMGGDAGRSKAFSKLGRAATCTRSEASISKSLHVPGRWILAQSEEGLSRSELSADEMSTGHPAPRGCKRRPRSISDHPLPARSPGLRSSLAWVTAAARRLLFSHHCFRRVRAGRSQIFFLKL